MSIRLWLKLLYTVPRKLSGSDSWNTNWLTSTRSPTVIVPLIMPWAPSTIMMVSAEENTKFCPELRNARDVAILVDAFSYVLSVASYCFISCFSLLNSCPSVTMSGTSTHLDCLVVDQRVHSTCSTLVVCSIRLLAELGTPCRGLDGEECVQGHGNDRYSCKVAAKLVRLMSA